MIMVVNSSDSTDCPALKSMSAMGICRQLANLGIKIDPILKSISDEPAKDERQQKVKENAH